MIIAIDGHSSCGKSTVAKDIAAILSLIYIDTGAMYRAVTLYFMEHSIDIYNLDQVNDALSKITISFQRMDDKNTTFLNGENVEDKIRNISVSSFVSEVSALAPVREKLVREQRAMASDGLVMDGRDIGTVVFPNADVKFYLKADADVRTRRRYDELFQKGVNPDIEEVRQNLMHRDYIDTHRDHSPLMKAEDAIEIDNTYLTRQEQLDVLLHYINNRQL